MTTVANITIDEEYGQIIIPVETGIRLNLTNFDWFKVNVVENHIVLSISKSELSEELIEALVHEGILIAPE